MNIIHCSCDARTADDKFTGRHGAQGVNDEASKATLDNEFGTHNEDECIMKILEAGSIQETEVRGLGLFDIREILADGRCSSPLSVRDRRMTLWELVQPTR